MRCPAPEELLLLVDGGQDPERATALEQHVSSCPACRGVLAAWQQSIDLVAAESDDYHSSARRSAILASLDAEPAARRSFFTSRPWPWVAGAGIASAAAAAAALVLWLAPTTSDDSGFQERGVSSDGAGTEAARWVGVRLFHLPPGADRPTVVRDRIGADDRLLFSYTNLSSEAFSWLSLVARDSSGAVYWYQPPRSEEERGPGSFEIAAEVSGREVPEAVRFPLAPGRMQLFALFTHRRLSRGEVESWIAGVVVARKELQGSPRWGESLVQAIAVEVVAPAGER